MMHHRTTLNNCQIGRRSLLLAIALLHAMPAAADPAAIVGRWQLDVAASDNAVAELKGIRGSKGKRRSPPGSDRPDRLAPSTQERYWEKANVGRDWQHSKELAHAGPVQRLLESENLEIVATDDGYLFIYADGYERAVVPNLAGRVFTASGDELVIDAIGHTLAYWDEASLLLETRIKRGGKLIERFTTSADGTRLTIKIEIDRRDWKWIAKLERIFDRADVTTVKTTYYD